MILVDGVWKQNKTVPNIDGEEVSALVTVPIMDVPVGELICKWEELVNELSDKEVELYNLKEAYLIAEADIVNNTDFKAIYGANNQKVRDNHVKSELSDMVSTMKSLEFGINWIRGYIPLLRECIRVKHDSTPHINSPTPIVLDGSHMTGDDVKRIRKALEELKQ